ncbi:Ku protein [Cohnella sp. WQ 127256]|uniref:non-homologous end joining protein Ku n=1 Tax=Cohnella sp. WQ 127256 TaxID=2938790 RepID=UPI00211742D2|nr:Ku protein [Cohnella sp. WQ 127256]
MHTIWKGTILISKFQIPVKLFAATEDNEISLKQTHKPCGSGISHLKFCKTCNTTVEQNQIQKVYEMGSENFVEVTDEDLKLISPQSNKNFVIKQFFHENELSFVYMKKHYYIGTDEVGEEVLQLLHQCLLKSKKVGIGYITLRSTQSLAAIRPMNNGIVLSTLHYADEVRSNQQNNNFSTEAQINLSSDHLFVFDQLVNAMTKPLEISSYGNKYNEELRYLLENKIANRLPNQNDTQDVTHRNNNFSELLSSLQRSLDYVKADTNLFFASDNTNQPH